MLQTINTIDGNYITEPNEEKVEITTDAIYSSNMSADEFDFAVRNQIQRAQEDAQKINLSNRQQINLKYYLSKSVDKAGVRDDLEKGAEPVIFRNIETIISIATSRTPELASSPVYKNDTTRMFAQNVRRALQSEWEVYQGMQQLVSQGIRNHQINFLGIYQLGYDEDTGEFWTEEVVATDCVISKNGKFFARYIKDETLGDLIDKFPDKEDAILESFGFAFRPTKELLASPVEYIEAWTDEIVGWKLNDLVLDVMDNPHFDYDGRNVQVGADENGAPKYANVKFNYFKQPRMPYIYLRYFTRGVRMYDETTLIEQAIGPQDWINKRKRQIGANADSTNGHWVSSGDFISQEEFDKIEGGIDEKIWLQNGLPADGLQKITGQPLPDYIFNDLLDSRQAADNLMGTHATIRGESSENPTLGQDMMSSNRDMGRIDGYVRDAIEKMAQEWYQYMYHLFLVYTKKDRAMAIPDDSDYEDDTVWFSQDRVPLIQKKDGEVIPLPLVLQVKQGSTLPRDEQAEYMRAMSMKDVLRPRDFFKKIGEANPRQLEKNYLMWINDPYAEYKDDPDIQEMLQRMAEQNKEQAKMSVSVRADATTPQGALLLEQQGLLPPGSAAAAAKQQMFQTIMQNKSPTPGDGGRMIERGGNKELPTGADSEDPTGNGGAMPGEKERLVNAMSDMIRSGEAGQIMGSGEQAPGAMPAMQ